MDLERASLRKRQRSLRKEQHSLMEERCWQFEQESLLRKILELNIRIKAMERKSPSDAAEAIANLASMLQVLKDTDYKVGGVGRLAESGVEPSPTVLEAVGRENVTEEEVFAKEIRILNTMLLITHLLISLFCPIWAQVNSSKISKRKLKHNVIS